MELLMGVKNAFLAAKNSGHARVGCPRAPAVAK